jgi:hypothetical protein
MEVPAGMKPSLAMLRTMHRVNRAAPIACLAALLGAGVLLSRQDTGDHRQAAVRAHAIRVAMADVPFIAGNWVGTDCPLPAGATEILMPTAVLSRRYVELGAGTRATLGLIHCGDVRDMHGHHPPSCYPSSGWQPRPEGHDVVALELDGEQFNASLYRFSATDSSGARREVSVVGFFVLPDAAAEGTYTSDMNALRDRAAKLEISRLGVGQVQVVMDGWPPATEVERVARELMQLVPVDCVQALKGAVADDVAAGPSRAQASDGVRARSVRMYGMPRLTVWDRGQGEEP